jgi:thioredoxin reductase (NADPH)
MHDVAIIGGGPAGLTAGIYASRAGLNAILFEKELPGGLMTRTELIENYPGFPDGIEGMDLAEKMEQQLRNFGAEVVLEEVLNIEKEGNFFFLNTQDGRYRVAALIIATGSTPSKIGVPGEDKLQGRGVSYCATCDAPLFRGKEVVVVGGGDTALQEAIYLTKFAKNVTVVHRRDKFRATKIISERAKNNPKIKFLMNCEIVEIVGEEEVEEVKIKSPKETFSLNCDGVFIFAGNKPNTEFLNNLVKMDEDGYIITNREMETSVRGIFACGDVRCKSYRQVVIACGEGAVSACSVKQYLENKSS